jgi:nucleotide-binding universal stress UspA family protein
MTRLLICYDASAAARAAIAAAGALFPDAEATVACVASPVTTRADETLVHAGAPDGIGPDDLEALQAREHEEAVLAALEGAKLAAVAGIPSDIRPLAGGTPWRALLEEARRQDSDVIVSGTRGEGAFERVLLGSTASSLLHHTARPLLVVPAGPDQQLDGPLIAGYDGSSGADAALRFAAAHLPGRRLVVAHAWRSPVRNTTRGRALLHAPVATLHDYATGVDEIIGGLAATAADAGVSRAQALGLDAEPRTPEASRVWLALLETARDSGAAAILVGARGRGALAGTVLGSVTSALVHAAAVPVVVVPST